MSLGRGERVDHFYRTVQYRTILDEALRCWTMLDYMLDYAGLCWTICWTICWTRLYFVGLDRTTGSSSQLSGNHRDHSRTVDAH
jgi:hypothetical protein